MYCPKCSQIQSSDEMRFCSRCGFPLAGVAMLVINDGVIPTTGSGRRPMPVCRKKVMGESAIFTAVAWTIAIAATAGFDAGSYLENLSKMAALLFFLLGLVGLVRFLYGFLFVKDLVDQPDPNFFPEMISPGSGAEAPRRPALSAQRGVPASDYSRGTNTREIAPQPSVTEHTTRLLQEQTTDRSD